MHVRPIQEGTHSVHHLHGLHIVRCDAAVCCDNPKTRGWHPGFINPGKIEERQNEVLVDKNEHRRCCVGCAQRTPNHNVAFLVTCTSATLFEYS